MRKNECQLEQMLAQILLSNLTIQAVEDSSAVWPEIKMVSMIRTAVHVDILRYNLYTTSFYPFKALILNQNHDI